MGPKKNHAVIETIIDESVHVTLVYQLQHFSRDWVESSSNWPISVVWLNDSDEDLDCRILKIDTKEECDNYASLYEQAKISRKSISYDSIDATVLVEQVNSLKNQVDELKKMFNDHQEQINQMRNGLGRTEVKECDSVKNDDCKYIGQYRQKVEYSQLMIALASSNDLDGFKVFVGSVFGPDFDQNKKNYHQNYEDFPEKSRLWELMAYYCHCRKMLDHNPGLRYGTSFPDYPSIAQLHEVPNEDNSELESFNPTSSSTSSNKRKNDCNSNQSANKKNLAVTLSDRTQKLCSSYAKTFTNYYHDEKKGEERKEVKRLRERERRAQKKLEAEAKKLAENQQSVQTVFFDGTTEHHNSGSNYY